MRTASLSRPPAHPSPPVARKTLVAASWRNAAYAAVLVFITAFAVLAVWVSRADGATGFDGRVLRSLYFRLGPNAASVTLEAANATIILIGLAFAALACALVRRFDAAALVVIAPTLSVGLTELVLKPLIARPTAAGASGDEISSYAFPSGHTAVLTGLTVSVALLLLRAPIGRTVRAVAILLLAAWTVTGAVGLTRNLYHYATDTIGAAFLSVACVVAVAIVIDRVRRVS